jgi:hypothetical protein
VGVQTFRPELPRDDLEIVSRHNDLNPNDILFDGARVWIVDWEGAFAADHCVDLAALANFMTPADLMPLRTIYFAAAPSRRQLDRLAVMRQASRLCYAFMLLHGGNRPAARFRPVDGGVAGPALHRRRETRRHPFEATLRLAGALYNAAADVAAGPGTVGAMAAMSSGGGLWLARFHPEILHARMVSPIQRRQPLWDRIVVGLLLVLLSPGSAG